MNSTTNASASCILLLRGINPYVRNLVTVLHGSLVLLIVGANMVLIFGIIKTKRKRFTSSQILFLTLFSCDLTYGVAQIPVEIYLIWKKRYPSCFESVVGSFSIIYPTCISGTILSAIGIDRYIRVVHNNYYKIIITNTSLTVTITLTILISIVLAIVGVNIKIRCELFFIAMSTYAGVVLAVGVVFNIALLKYVKQKTKKIICTTGNQFKFNENSNFDFSFPGGCLFAVNDHSNYYFLSINSFHRQIHHHSLSCFSLDIDTTSSKCCTQFSDLLFKKRSSETLLL